MTKIWIPKKSIPTAEQNSGPELYQEMIFQEQCPKCTGQSTINNCGASTFCAIIYPGCMHYYLWSGVWENRIKEDNSIGLHVPTQIFEIKVIKSRSNQIDSVNDGMKCSGSCGSWVPMASANQADGFFICYGCRNRF